MPITFQFACPLAMAEKLKVALEYNIINNIHVNLITSKILPAQFEVLVAKDLKTAEVIVKLLNIKDFKTANVTQLEMITYGFYYRLSNGLVMNGRLHLELNVASPEKKVVMSFTPKSLPMVSTELRMTGWTIKAHMMSSYVTLNVLYLLSF